MRLEHILQKDFCAIIITYMPSAQIVLNINALFQQGISTVIIVDNTPAESFFSELSLGVFEQAPQIINNKKNLGIARALNQGLEVARNLGYKWAFTFDQDTAVNKHFVFQMGQILERILVNTVHPVAVLGPNYIDQALSRPAHNVDSATDAVEVRDVITSGSLLSVEAFNSVAGFSENYFIDMVDTDFCFRVRQAGYSVCRTSEPLMEHSLGRLTPRKVLGFRFNVTNHLPQRRYYIFRNSIDMVKKYFFFDVGWCLFILFNYLPKVFIKACVFEERKKENLHFIMLGVLDGVFSRFSRKVL